MLLDMPEHDASANVVSLVLFVSCVFISIKTRNVIRNPGVKRNWNVFIALTINNTFFHSLSVASLIAGEQYLFGLMASVVFFFDSIFAFLLFTGFYFVTKESWLSFDKIDDAFKAKSSFMHSMSHEMRTPLNAITGNADMLVNGLLGELRAEQVPPVRDILSSAIDLLRMTDTILENTSVTPEHFDIRDFVVKGNQPELKSIINRMCDKLRETGHAGFVDDVMATVPDGINAGLRGN